MASVMVELVATLCGFDGLDCIAFNADYPFCDANVPSLLNDRLCDSEEIYTNNYCGFNGGYCLRFMKQYPSCQIERPDKLGDRFCDDPETVNCSIFTTLTVLLIFLIYPRDPFYGRCYVFGDNSFFTIVKFK